MKMIMIAYNEAIDEEVMAMLRGCVQAEYTKWTKVLGWGQHSEPHLLTHVWPKGNNVLMVCVERGKGQADYERDSGVAKDAQQRRREGVLCAVG